MSDILSTIILFIIGTLAGFINVTAGGGSTLTLPALIFMGLDSAVANGTNRIAIFVQNISAIYSFKKENYQEFPLSLRLSLFTLPGAVTGAIIATKVGDTLFQHILGIVMILVVLSLVIPRKKIEVELDKKGKTNPVVYLAMFGIGFYGGFIQVGVGFLLMASLHYLMRLSLVYVNMHKVFIVFIYTIPALLIFIVTGNVNWKLGLSLAVGNAFGAWWAAKLSVKRGEKLIKAALLIAVVLMSLKLFGVF